MTEFRGEIELFVDESVYPFAIELARELDDSGALWNDDETPLQDPPIRLCLSIIANNSEGLQRLIHANVSKVGWSIMFPEPEAHRLCTYCQERPVAGDGFYDRCGLCRTYRDAVFCEARGIDQGDVDGFLDWCERTQTDAMSTFDLTDDEWQAINQDAPPPQRLYVEDSEPVDITTTQAQRLLITGLAYYVTPEDKGVQRLSAEDPGDLHLVTIYAVPGDTSPNFPFTADRWMWQIGDNWVAVADWEREAEWFEDLERDGIETPTPRVRELHDLPPHGTLTYRNSDHVEVVMTVQGQGLPVHRGRGTVVPHHHRTDIVGEHLYGSHEREHVTEAHGLPESERQDMSDSAVHTWHTQQRHAGVSLVETFGLTPIDAERLLRFAAAAAEAGILNDNAAWQCGFDTSHEPDANNVVDVARRAAAYIKEHGL